MATDSRNDNAAREQLVDLVRKRGSLKTAVTKFKNYLLSLDPQEMSERARFILQAKLDKINNSISKFEEIQDEIEAQTRDLATEQGERDAFEDAYFDAMGHAQEILSITNHQGLAYNLENNEAVRVTPQLIAPPPQVQLPKIDLPKFSGSQSNWLEFRDLFRDLIHANTSLGNIQKFHYLRASLSGEAALVIQSHQLSADCYEEAWKLVCERYNNEKQLISNYIREIFNIQPLGKENAAGLYGIVDNVSKCLNGLKMLKQPTDQWDTLLIFIISSKLDSATSREWESQNAKFDSMATLPQLLKFMRDKADLLGSIAQNNTTRGGNTSHSTHVNKPIVNKQGENQFRRIDRSANTRFHPQSYVTQNSKCHLCSKDHFTSQCSILENAEPEKRYAIVKNANLCTNCLRRGHFARNCQSSKCKICKGLHNTVLHVERQQANTNTNIRSNEDKFENSLETTEVDRVVVSACNADNQVLLSTALVNILDISGKRIKARVLLDSGSQSNFVTLQLAQRLKIPQKTICLNITGITQSSSSINATCKATIQALQGGFKLETNFLVVPQITGSLPQQKINVSRFKIPQHINLADPTFNVPSEIDILLGAQHFWNLLSIGQVCLGPGLPIMHKTRLGWILAGPLGKFPIDNSSCNIAIESSHTDKLLENFWKIEDISEDHNLSNSSDACEAFYVETTKLIANKFIVKLPFKDNPRELGDSYTVALNRFLSLERRLNKNRQLKEKYISFMQEYLNLGHMSEVQLSEEQISRSYFLPHHAVINNSSATTKTRVVFDGSSKSSSGQSLNDVLHVGPVLQGELFDLLIRFRKYEFVITGDIEKMYRQVLIHPDQRKYQTIIWRFDSSEPLRYFQLNTVTYGTSSASYLAIRSLQETQRFTSNERVKEMITNDFYVDDLLTGGSSVSDIVSSVVELNKTLKCGNFNLRKWTSNNPEILCKLRDAGLDTAHEFKLTDEFKTLGLNWQPCEDVFFYKVGNRSTAMPKVTKRNILAIVSQIFDPLGLIAPVTIQAKVLLQGLWLEKLSWDESVPVGIHTNWLSISQSLQEINRLSIPRNVIPNKPSIVELHGFCDASSMAYGACIYMRSTSENQIVTSRLLCAKTRVAPLKTISIPKLELCSAQLLAKLVKRVIKCLQVKINQIFLWTDSSIVLSWLKTPPNSLKTFVANRVSYIITNTQEAKWQHISSKHNPADILSRGMPARELLESTLWWHGPSWLTLQPDAWPKTNVQEVNVPEMKKKAASICAALSTYSKNSTIVKITDYSCLSKLERIVAYCFRFITNTRCKNTKNTGYLKANEIKEAAKYLVKAVQAETFANEINHLRAKRELSPKSKILSLAVFLDNDNILRVGGRLRHSQFDYQKRHPILLPSNHHLTKLIIERIHKRLLHIGPQGLLNAVRDQYWPISGKNCCKKVVHGCIVCFRASPLSTFPQMGDLPADRVTPGHPFEVSGVDYAGPFMLKPKHSRGAKQYKAYLALFVCFKTKALHLELVTALSSDAFLAALRRFIARRGKPVCIWSDNATNFVGANNELTKFLKENRDNIEENVLKEEGIKWQFIPARSPTFGGLWEAGVKSAKFHLKRVISDKIYTYEDFYTIIVQVEAILNSRPLSPLSNDPNDLDPITPAHFLIGRKLTTVPECDTANLPDGRLNNYEKHQAQVQRFWKSWSQAYLNQLQQRTKWKRKQNPQISVGQLCLLNDDNLPPMRWKMARIVHLHPGNDGKTRVVSVKTNTGISRRAVNKISVLPAETPNFNAT